MLRYPINDLERRKRELDEDVTRVDVERLVQIWRDNIPAGRDLLDVRREDRTT